MTEFSFLAAAHEVPAEPALVVGTRVLRFAELAPRVAGEVEALSRQGMGAAGGARSARLTAAVSVDFTVRFYALLELGVSVILLHPRWTERERARAAAVDPGAWDLDDLPPARPVECVCGLGRLPQAGPATTLAVVFTSGSTRAPRGVVLSRRSFSASARASARRLGWRRDDRWLLSLPPSHVGGLSILIRCLAARRAVILADGSDPAAMWRSIVDGGVTLASMVAPQLRRLLEAGVTPPKGLRAVLLGGGPASPELLDEAAAAWWPVLPTYGLSEACSQVATVRPGTRPAAANGVGPPLDGLEVRIHGSEIQLRGEMVMDGYLPRGVFEEPFTGDGWLATEDLGFFDELGNLHVTGRRDDLIVTGGENVAPQDVEAVLEVCPGVREAVVFGLPDPVWGEVVAAAIATRGAIDESAVRDFCDARLAPFKRPRRLFVLAALPRTAMGKADRRTLRRRYAPVGN